MTGLVRHLPRSSALLVALALLAPASARGVDCALVDTSICDGSIDGVSEGWACLCAATPFLDEARAIAASFTSFDEILASDYEQPGKYEESRVDAVIGFAAAIEPGISRDELLYEASFRKASAHGMFGDDSLLRGLDPSFEAAGSTGRIAAALERLDSRSCALPGPPPVSTGAPCTVSADCGAGEACANIRFAGSFGGPGPFGAVQEYRRGEQALVEAIRALGADRFAVLDAGEGQCQGIGCATRLLVRLGAMKLRAQAEHADLLWARSIGASGFATDALRCAAGGPDRICSLHADCDEAGVPGTCGSTPAERTAVLLRTFVQEAAAESAAAEALYARVLAPGALGDSADWRFRATAAGLLQQVEARSLTGITPFGLPFDYVPLLTPAQQGSLDCLQSCPAGFCDQASNASCLIQLAEDPGVLGLLSAAESAQQSAQASAQDYADRIRNLTLHESELESDLERAVERLFGLSCEDLGVACSCDAEDRLAGRCVVLGEGGQQQTWEIAGAVCAPDDGCAALGDVAVDGELERQLLAIRSAEQRLQQIELEIAQNQERLAETEARYAEILGVRAEECEGIEAAIRRAGNDLNDAIDERERVLRPTLFERLSGIVTATIGAQTASVEIGEDTTLEAGNLVGQILFRGVSGATGAIPTFLEQRSEERRRKARVEFEKVRAQIERDRQLTVERLRCQAQAQILEINQDEALAELRRAIDRLLLEVERQNLALLDALAASQQLLVQLDQAQDRVLEAQELQEIWDNLEFRNPANYRFAALEKQLEGAGAFRGAQVLTWMILRAVAYDLAQPDLALPQNFLPGQVLQIADCRSPTCSGPGAAPCASDAQCPVGESCQASTTTEIADSDGSCSLQAVFQARTVAQLRNLIRTAALQLVSTGRTLGACQEPEGCRKRISLRNLFTDPLVTLGQQQPLGEVLLDREPEPPLLVSLDFEVAIDRELQLCPQLEDGSLVCASRGTANLSRADVDGAGDLTTNFWNVRALDVRGSISWADPLRSPASLMCRNPADGEIFDPSLAACSPIAPEGTDCTVTLDCETPGGAPTTCKCLRLIDDQSAPVVSLAQLQPGVVRTRFAEPYQGLPVTDRRLRYRMWRTDELPLLGRTPALRPFSVPSLALAPRIEDAAPSPNIKGVPVASSTWRLVLDSQVLNQPFYRRAFLRAIADIELQIRYQGFDL